MKTILHSKLLSAKLLAAFAVMLTLGLAFGAASPAEARENRDRWGRNDVRGYHESDRSWHRNHHRPNYYRGHNRGFSGSSIHFGFGPTVVYRTVTPPPVYRSRVIYSSPRPYYYQNRNCAWR